MLLPKNIFVRCVYIPDVIAIAGAYKDWFNLGKCSPNYIAVPDIPMNSELTEFGLKGGIIIGDNFREIKTWKDEALRKGITENTTHAWYKNPQDTLHPYDGEQIPSYTDWQENGKYSWAKAPRFEDNVTQTGPISQVLSDCNNIWNIYTSYKISCIIKKFFNPLNSFHIKSSHTVKINCSRYTTNS